MLSAVSPGLVFGLAVALIFSIHLVRSDTGVPTLSQLPLVFIPFVGAFCYVLASFITSWGIVLRNILVDANGMDYAFFITPIVAALGGFVATYIFLMFLQTISKGYPQPILKLSIYGGLLDGLLIDSLLLNDMVTYGTASMTRDLIFFIPWQTIMLLLISGHLLKRPNDPATVSTPPTPQQ